MPLLENNSTSNMLMATTTSDIPPALPKREDSLRPKLPARKSEQHAKLTTQREINEELSVVDTVKPNSDHKLNKVAIGLYNIHFGLQKEGAAGSTFSKALSSQTPGANDRLKLLDKIEVLVTGNQSSRYTKRIGHFIHYGQEVQDTSLKQQHLAGIDTLKQEINMELNYNSSNQPG